MQVSNIFTAAARPRDWDDDDERRRHHRRRHHHHDEWRDRDGRWRHRDWDSWD